MRKTVIATMMAVGMFVGGGIASALPANAPNVVGLSEYDAVAVLEAAGVDVRVATRNGSGPRPDSCVVVHQQDLSGKTKIKRKYLGDGEWSRTTIEVPPSTTLNVVC